MEDTFDAVLTDRSMRRTAVWGPASERMVARRGGWRHPWGWDGGVDGGRAIGELRSGCW